MVKSCRVNTRNLARTDSGLRMAHVWRMDIDWLIGDKLDNEKNSVSTYHTYYLLYID